MLTVLSTFVRRPTLSKMATKALKAPWIHAGSDAPTILSSDPAWLQGAFSALVAIFDRLGLRTNVVKTVSMACHPCRAGTVNRTTEGYRRRLTGDGSSFRERHRERVACRECGAAFLCRVIM